MGGGTIGSTGRGDPREALVGLYRQSLVSRAAELGRRGRYEEAESVLAGLGREEADTTSVLDLKARLAAQRGLYHQAELYWRRALEHDPENEAIRAGLQRLAGRRERRLRLRLSWVALLALALAAAAVWLGLLLKKSWTRTEILFKSEIKELSGRLSEETSAPRRRELPEIRVDTPGVKVQKTGGGLTLVFEAGLFTRGALITPGARSLLTSLGQKLEPWVGKIEVCVVGVTDDIPVPGGRLLADNYALGLARAVAVAEHLRATTKLPASLFTATSSGEFEAPYTNLTPTDRLKNRTVILKISAKSR